MKSNKPIAVLISDVHYNLQTLPLADASMRQAIDKANNLGVPLIVAGDLHDTKANMRAECINAMQKTFKLSTTQIYLMRGNHDSINEKSKEHALEFLAPYIAGIADTLPFKPYDLDFCLLPYTHDLAELKEHIKNAAKTSKTIIMHQGLSGSLSGEYIQDKTAITPKDVAGLRIISGHYHTRQTIKLPKGGKWDYIGNPFTLNFGEANDPEKGYQILYEDGSLEFVPTNLRKHVIWNEFHGEMRSQPSISSNDLLWIKMHGTKEQLSGFTKKNVPLTMPFKLDLIYTGSDFNKDRRQATQAVSKAEYLDILIDSAENVSADRKQTLKELWKTL